MRRIRQHRVKDSIMCLHIILDDGRFGDEATRFSGPTSTTIARIPHGKGERPTRTCHNQSQTSAPFDCNLTVEAYIRHQWLPDLSKTRAGCGIRSTSAKLPMNHSTFQSLIAARFADPIVSLPPYQFARYRS